MNCSYCNGRVIVSCKICEALLCARCKDIHFFEEHNNTVFLEEIEEIEESEEIGK